MRKTLMISTVATATLVAGTLYAANHSPATSPTTPAPASAAIKKVKDGNTQFINNAYITLSGTVGEIHDSNGFELLHPGGSIRVDTNNAWPDLFDNNGSNVLRKGNRVTVTGRVDNQMFSDNKIEAYQLTVSGEHYTRVYSNPAYAPTEHAANSSFYDTQGINLRDDDDVRITGVVSRIINKEEFMLDYGGGEIRVDADDVDYTNTTRLNVGDEVMVYGEVEDGWFKRKTLEAERIILTRSARQTMR